MCGRFANQLHGLGSWEDILGSWPYDTPTGYNIAPTRNIPVLYLNRKSSTLQGKGMRWGLIPAWSKTFDSRFATFNARAETLKEKPTFKTAWETARTCLIPALGYYEWKGEQGEKQPYLVRTKSGEPLVMAGLWECWEKQHQARYSCTIITRASQGPLTEIHARMPVLVSHERAVSWLEDGTNWFNIINCQQHVDNLEFYPVSREVNRLGNTWPGLLDRVEFP